MTKLNSTSPKSQINRIIQIITKQMKFRRLKCINLKSFKYYNNVLKLSLIMMPSEIVTSRIITAAVTRFFLI